MYFFDPYTDKDGKMFLVPHVHGKDSPSLPGFLISGEARERYRPVVEAIWKKNEGSLWEPGVCQTDMSNEGRLSDASRRKAFKRLASPMQP